MAALRYALYAAVLMQATVCSVTGGKAQRDVSRGCASFEAYYMRQKALNTHIYLPLPRKLFKRMFIVSALSTTFEMTKNILIKPGQQTKSR